MDSVIGINEIKGHIINALRMSGYSSEHIKTVMKNLEKSLKALPKDEAESLYAKSNTK